MICEEPARASQRDSDAPTLKADWLLTKPETDGPGLQANRRRRGYSPGLFQGLRFSMVLHQGGMVGLDHILQALQACSRRWGVRNHDTRFDGIDVSRGSF